MRVAVVVLGDLGRSPRMLYHALALAAHDVDVDLVGYAESTLPEAVRTSARIVVHDVGKSSRSAAGSGTRVGYLASAVGRGLSLLGRLPVTLLWRVPRPNLILVQNPPGVPTLAVAWLAARLRGARFAIDWHNLTHAMLALRLWVAHPFVRLVAWYEGLAGRCADVNLFVSEAMASALRARWKIAGVVFRDGPAELFQPIAPDERISIRTALRTRLDLPFADAPFAMAVSPTSWTADEDFDLLFDAVAACEAQIRDEEAAGRRFPDLLILLTGRGPLRERYEARIRERTAGRIHLRTLWLEPGEYPRILAAADLGICLHRSASGLDLPMKVADMFGAGLPVCALDYGPCLSEVVQHGANGLLFSTAEELARQLYELFKAWPAAQSELASLRNGVFTAQPERWQAAWNRDVWPAVSCPTSAIP